MSCLSWNYCGLGHQRTVQVLMDLGKSKNPSFIFLMKTLYCRDKLEAIKVKLGYEGLFVVDKVGRSGGLAFFWKSKYKVNLLKYGRNFINIAIEELGLGKWRATSFYGFPESYRRRDLWNLLRSLASFSKLS